MIALSRLSNLHLAWVDAASGQTAAALRSLVALCAVDTLSGRGGAGDRLSSRNSHGDGGEEGYDDCGELHDCL
jgi:hypothetical protein